MSSLDQDRAEGDIERLRQALDAETEARIEVERRLERANAEFEQFVSMAAHNLRQSLRDVASFSQLMAETCASRLDADAGTFLSRIRGGAAGMQSLLGDVVDYWATGTGDGRSSPTDMDAALRQALLSLDKQIVEASAVVTHDSLPRVYGDFATLTKVLHHLIRNAIQYRGTTTPRIHVSARCDGPDWTISVQDNGPGIDPAFQDRVFGVFQRLHGKEQPGNGLGLAFCRKAVEWLGGRIRIESTLGAGSTFYFTLPSAD
jgi:light-regulated signal transduction histidine kinase (bacteriophytochrome)